MRLRTIVTPLLIAAFAISLTGCGAGSNASTRLITVPTTTAEPSSSATKTKFLRAILLFSLRISASWPSVTFLINRVDALLGLAIPGIQAQFTGVSTISQNQTIRFEGDSSNAKAFILGANLKPGTHTDLSLFFGNAGEVKFDVLVQKPAGIYEGITA